MEAINELLQSCTVEELSVRVKAYHTLTENLSKLPQGSDWGQEINRELAKQIISNLKTDLFNEENDVSYEVTGFLGCFLANEKLMDLLTGEEEQDILDSLIKLLVETKAKPVLTRGLWSLAQSKFECETYNKNLSKLLTVIIDILKCDPTNIIIYETLQVMKSLLESVPKEVIEKVEDWFPQIFEYLFHDVHRIRGVAYSCLNFCQLYNQHKLVHLHKYIIPFIPKLKSHYCKQMKQFVEDNCTFVLKIWRLLVLILGKNLHSRTTLINGFLEVVEKAFKSPKSEFRVDAFKCWYVLIGNFSNDIEVLTQPKRLKLLIAPLKSNNAKTEDIAYMKLHTWYFLLSKVENHIIEHFDLVVIPLLKFCFNSNRILQSGASERTLLMSGAPTPCTKYNTLLLKACEVLARVLSQDNQSLCCFTLADLSQPVINESLFAKNSTLIFGCIADALTSLEYENKEHRELGCLILQTTLKHIVSITEANPTKKECVELVKELFKLYEFIEQESKSGDTANSFAYEFLKMIIIGDVTFSHHILHSSQYYIPVGSKLRDMMNGTLSNFLAHKLTTPGLLNKAFMDTSDFCKLWEAVLQKSKPSNKLIFLEAVIEQLRCTIPSFQPQNSEVLIALWMAVAKVLHNHIKETQQINQGDNNEYDWSCIFNTLIFPVNCPEENVCSISSTVYEDLIGTWSTLWHRFSTLSPLTATAEPNCEADLIARRMLSTVLERFSGGIGPPDGFGFTLAFAADLLYIVVDKFRFKEIGRRPKKMLQSPLKQRKKSHPLHNLSSIIELMNLLMEKTLSLVTHWRQKAMQKLCLSYTKVFTGLTQDRFVWPLISGVTDIMKKALQVNPIAKFNVEVEQRFTAMWTALCGLIECRVVPKLTQEQLVVISPLIAVALQSSHLGLRQRTRLMWTTSFASTSLSIPQDLFDILKVVALPPASISEMPATESQSLSPKENIPTHISGSFLNREKNQEFTPFSLAQQQLQEKLTPPKSVHSVGKSPKVKSSGKKVSLDDLKAEDFVAIPSPKPSKRVLTPHQAEKMKERRTDIPALYNDLSQTTSQLPSQFLTQDSLEASTANDDSSSLTFKGKIGSTTPPSSPRPSPKDDSKNRSYSDEDLEEVLRNASLEMERSFSGGKATTDTSGVKPQPDRSSSIKPSKKTLTFKSPDAGNRTESSSRLEGAESSCKKRKSSTPSRKSLDDIRRTLKGATAESRQSVGPRRKEAPPKAKPDSSPLASPLKSPPKSHAHAHARSSLPRDEKDSTDSDEEIPNSQAKANSCLLLYPSFSPRRSLSHSSPAVDRPRRNKRKTFGDGAIYITPTKRPKPLPSPTKENPVVLLKKDDSLSPAKDSPSAESGGGSEAPPKRDPAAGSNKPLMMTPSKVTRSGRRIVAPNRDMPEPMTPPGGGPKRVAAVEEKSAKSVPLKTRPPAVGVKSASDSEAPPGGEEGGPSSDESDGDESNPRHTAPPPKKKVVPATQVRHSRRISLRRGEGGPVPAAAKAGKAKTSPVEDEKEVEVIKDVIRSPAKEKSPLKQDLTSSSILFKTAETAKITTTPPTCAVSSSSLSTSAIFVASKGDTKMNGVSSSWPNKYKVIFSPKFVSKETSAVSEGMHLANGGIVFAKTHAQKVLIGKEAEPPSLRKSKSLERFSPSKGVGASLQLLQVNFKKVGNVSDDRVKTNGISSPTPLDASVAKLRVKDIQNSHLKLEDKQKDALHPNIATKGTQLFAMRVSPSSKELGSSLTPPKALIAEKVVIRTSASTTSPRKNLPKESSPKASPLKLDSLSSPPKLQFLPENPQSPKSPGTDPPKAVNLICRDDAKTRLIISPTQKTQKIFLVSSSKSSSSSPIQKFIYTSQGGAISPLGLRSAPSTPAAGGGEGKNHILVVSGKTKSPTEGLSPKKAPPSSPEAKELRAPAEAPPAKDEEKAISAERRREEEPLKIDPPEEEEVEILMEVKPPLKSEVKKDEEKASLVEKVSISDIVAEEEEEKKEKEFPRRRGRLLRKLSRVNHKKGLKLSRRKAKFGSEIRRRIREAASRKTPAQAADAKPEVARGPTDAGGHDSPDKNVDSRLTACVSTPERKKLSVRRVQVPGSRAAIMVACAKRTMKTRIDEGASEGPATEAGQASPTITPSRKRPLLNGYPEGKPWARHEPSPGASPCGSILKKRPAEDEALPTVATAEILDFATDGSPSSAKCRRVSFADPPVSESVEIPPSPKTQKNYKAQKRLDMTQVLNAESPKIECDTREEACSKISGDAPRCRSEPLYSSLISCTDDIDVLVPLLASPPQVEGLKTGLKERGIKTVGEFSALSQMEVESLPVQPPKASHSIRCLKDYEEKLETKKENESSKDAAEPTPKSVSEEAVGPSPSGSPPPSTDAPNPRPEQCQIEFGPDVEPDNPAAVEREATSPSKDTEPPLSSGEEKGAEATSSSERISESEFPSGFCRQIEADSTAIPSFIEGLGMETRLRLFEAITDLIPYKNVVQAFHRYLLKCDPLHEL